MSIEKSQQMNNKQMNTNHKGHPDSADLRRDGIFHPDSEVVFTTLEAYETWYGRLAEKKMVVGILTHYDTWSKRKATVETALVRELESQGVGATAWGRDGLRESADHYRAFFW